MTAVRIRLVPLFVLSMLAVACATSSPGPESSSASSAASQPASELAEPTAKPCVPGFVCGTELVAGKYTSTSTGATVTFALAGTGWSGREDTPGEGFALFNDAVGGQHGISVVAYDGEIFTDVCSPGPTEQIGGAPAELIAFIATVKGVQAEQPVETTVGGKSAIRLDLTTDSPCPDDRMWLWTLPEGSDFHFNDAERIRVYALEAGGATVVIVIEAFAEADYEVLLHMADAVIATMSIQPSG